jgi:hypothetical protein
MSQAGDLVGNVYILQAGLMDINGGAIKGDVKSIGKITVNASFVLNHPELMVDNPNTAGVDESQPKYHGVFIYNFPNEGVGELVVVGSPVITGNSGRIHSFVGYPDITGTTAQNLFCEHRDSGNNRCKLWDTGNQVWARQATVGG